MHFWSGMALAATVLPGLSDAAWAVQWTADFPQSAGGQPQPANIVAPRDNFPRRPLIGAGAEWISGPRGLAASNINTTFPVLLPSRGPNRPPPLVTVGFEYTNLFQASQSNLPEDLYEYSIGLTRIQPINQRWKVLTILGAGMATDGWNQTSDAWQFRGGVLGLYQPNDNWKWTVGAFATGREDLPVIPAVGLVVTPRPDLEIDLTFPRPAIRHIIRQSGNWQDLVWAGAGIAGTTWAYERPRYGDDRLTYRDIRVVAGWERRQVPRNGMPAAAGNFLRLEIGYAMARELEFLDDTQTAPLDGGFIGSLRTRF